MSKRCAVLFALVLAILPGAAQAAPDGRNAQARLLLQDMVGLRSAKGHAQGPILAQNLAARFRNAGFAEEDLRILQVDADDGEKLAALIVRYRASAPAKARPIALLGHLDVVDADAGLWETDPFHLSERDGYWYGRGSADNKGQVAAIAAVLMQLKQSGWVPGRDVLLALSGDEESGSLTTRALLQDPWLRDVEYAINGDTGGGQVDADGKHPVFDLQVAEKTSVSFKLSSRNRGGHSSAPRPDNALYAMADAIQSIKDLRFPVRIEHANRGMIEGLVRDRAGELGNALSALLANPQDRGARTVVERYPEDAHVLWTTCVPTMIAGGSARNALPQLVELTVHCRIFPGDAIDSVQAALVAAVANPDVEVKVDAARGSSPPSPLRDDVLQATSRALGALYPGAEVRPSMSSGGSDGRYFRQAGIATYGINPMAEVRPAEDRAHGIGERLRIVAFDQALPFWDSLLRMLAGSSPGEPARSADQPTN